MKSKKHNKYTEVYSTKDYAWFKKTKGNRPSTDSHYKKIKNSIVEKDLKMVIYVSSDGPLEKDIIHLRSEEILVYLLLHHQ